MIADIIILYILIGMVITSGYMKLIFKVLRARRVKSKYMQILYVIIIVLIWPSIIIHFKR